MANPKSGFKEIAEVIETDQAIAAKVLQVSNSAYLRIVRHGLFYPPSRRCPRA